MKKPDSTGISRDKEGKFLKGTSGNPKGRAEGSYSLITILKQKLAKTIKESGKEAGEDLVETWLKMSKKDFNALKEIVHYTDGKPKESMDLKVELEEKVDPSKVKEFIKWRKSKK